MNTVRGYGLTSRLLHFVMSLMVIVQLAAGFWMVDLPGPDKLSIYASHKTSGLFILLLALIRLVWRSINVIPALNEPCWKVMLARTLHRTFYVLLIAMPLAGWAMATLAGKLPTFPGLGEVALPYADMVTIGFARTSHIYLAYILAGLITVHASIGLYHAYLKDGVFTRMFFDRT